MNIQTCSATVVVCSATKDHSQMMIYALRKLRETPPNKENFTSLESDFLGQRYWSFNAISKGYMYKQANRIVTYSDQIYLAYQTDYLLLPTDY